MNSELHHQSVLKDEVLEWLCSGGQKRFLDVTLGLGGHSLAMLTASDPEATLTALDADTENIAIAEKRLLPFIDRCTLIHANFGDVATLHLGQFDAILADLGLSSPHIDDPSRGFSFRVTGPLDLRFDRTTGITAAELLRTSDQEALKTIFQQYGELYKEAKRLVEKLAGADVPTTEQLKVLVEELYGFNAKQILPQVFQALRIAVNDELGVLERLLDAIPQLLAPGGRVGIMSYHSLEDRMVKHVFRELSTPEKDPITGKKLYEPEYEVLTKKPIVPTKEEIAENPRARSAKFRVLARRSAY